MKRTSPHTAFFPQSFLFDFAGPFPSSSCFLIPGKNQYILLVYPAGLSLFSSNFSSNALCSILVFVYSIAVLSLLTLFKTVNSNVSIKKIQFYLYPILYFSQHFLKNFTSVSLSAEIYVCTMLLHYYKQETLVRSLL